MTGFLRKILGRPPRPVLAIRALNEYRRLDPFIYLGLRYHLEAVASPGDAWTREVTAHHFSHRSHLCYRRGFTYKNVLDDGEIEHRLLHIPSPAAALCEAVLLESLSQRRTFSGRQSHVYSYQLADPGTRSGFFEPFHTLYKQRLIDVRAACVARPGHEVVSMDVKRFYPSVPRKQIFNEFLHACRSESLDPVAFRVAESFPRPF